MLRGGVILSWKRGHALDEAASKISRILMFISLGMMLMMMFLGGADVIGRYLFNNPIVGVFEITEILMAGIVFFGLAYTQRVKGHVVVDFVYSRLPPKIKAVIEMLNTVLLLCLFVMISWRGIMTAITQYKRHREIINLGLPYYLFQLFVPLGALVMCLVLIVEILKFFNKTNEGD
jgi:TRAP-type C4-dicarboxylate transport system permease small subunit